MLENKYFHQIYNIFQDDAEHILDSAPLFFREIDIQILDNAALMGDMNQQVFELAANDIVSYRDSKGIDLRWFHFKNNTPGSDIQVVVSGIKI